MHICPRDTGKQVLLGSALDMVTGIGGVPVAGVPQENMSFLLHAARTSAASSSSMVELPLSRYLRVGDLEFINFPGDDVFKVFSERAVIDEAITTPGG